MVRCDEDHHPGKTRARGYLEVAMQLHRNAKTHFERRHIDIRVPEYLLELQDLMLNKFFQPWTQTT